MFDKGDTITTRGVGREGEGGAGAGRTRRAIQCVPRSHVMGHEVKEEVVAPIGSPDCTRPTCDVKRGDGEEGSLWTEQEPPVPAIGVVDRCGD